MSSSVLPPGTCGVHGYHGRSACPNCSTSTLPFTPLIQPPPPASVSPAEPDLMGELTALANAFHRVVGYMRAPTRTITESEAAEIADAALFRAGKVIDRGR